MDLTSRNCPIGMCMRSYGFDIPLRLPRVPELIAEERIENGFSDRTLVTIGHSLGGDAVAVCAIGYPKLFSSVILTETTLFPPSNNSDQCRYVLIHLAGGRLGLLDKKPGSHYSIRHSSKPSIRQC